MGKLEDLLLLESAGELPLEYQNDLKLLRDAGEIPQLDEKTQLLNQGARADVIKTEADKQLKDYGVGQPGQFPLHTGSLITPLSPQPYTDKTGRPLTAKEVGLQKLEGGGIEPRPITNSPAFMAAGMGPVARATGLVSKLLGATAVGATGGAVAPFVDKPPKEAIKEVPVSVLENAAAYGIGEGIAYPISRLAANVIRGGKTALTGKSTEIAGKELVKPITPAEAAVVQATTHVSKADLNAGFKSIPKSVAVMGDALDTVAKNPNVPAVVAMKQATEKQVEVNAKAVTKVAEAIVEPPDMGLSKVRNPVTNELVPMYHGTQNVFNEFDPIK